MAWHESMETGTIYQVRAPRNPMLGLFYTCRDTAYKYSQIEQLIDTQGKAYMKEADDGESYS